MIPRLNVFNYPCSHSAPFNLHTLRTVCECRCQPLLSHENQSCTWDKNQFIWLQYTLLPESQVYHVPTPFPRCLVFVFFTVYRRPNVIFHNLDIYFFFLSTAFFFDNLLSVLSGIFILSAFASPTLANLSAHWESHALVEAASLEFNTFFRIRRLGSQDCVVPGPQTRGA